METLSGCELAQAQAFRWNRVDMIAYMINTNGSTGL